MHYNDHLRGKVFIVTAAGEAGRAKAACYAARGARVALAARDHAQCLALARDLGPRVIVVDADVGSAAGWLCVVRATLDAFGRIDGVFDDGRIHDPSREDDESAEGAARDGQFASDRLDDAILV
jgi:NAD(P)-dependent dehydrogenase (short-subunit alcohol dehydrogenase family)